MRIDIVTLFPELCDSFLSASILGRARAKNLFEAHCHQIRDYTKNKQKQTDDYPYGGGCGMVLYAQPIADCLRAVQAQCAGQGRQKPHVVFLTAAGRPYNEEKARELASYDAVTLVCGHYEGIDQRVIDAFGDEEISIGDYVLTGGELASLVVADSVLRLQPGVLAEEKGYQDESYWDGLLEYPQFTRPEVWEGRAVPPVLLTGDHKKIDEWRGAQSRERTRERRPDLYDAWCESHPLTELPKWKRGENMRLVKNDEQLALCAALMAEGRRTVGELGHLFVTESARGKGYGAKMLDFARKKLAEHPHPTFGVLSTNTRAIALYKRMGWRLTGTVLNVYDPENDAFTEKYCEEWQMRYQG